jgi:hypothetical protein
VVARTPLHQRVGDQQQREHAVPEHIKPDRGLRPRAKQPVLGKQAGECQLVQHGKDRGEQIRARDRQNGARLRELELQEDQDRGDEIVDGERRLIGRDKRRRVPAACLRTAPRSQRSPPKSQ